MSMCKSNINSRENINQIPTHAIHNHPNNKFLGRKDETSIRCQSELQNLKKTHYLELQLSLKKLK